MSIPCAPPFKDNDGDTVDIVYEYLDELVGTASELILAMPDRQELQVECQPTRREVCTHGASRYESNDVADSKVQRQSRRNRVVGKTTS